jgi:RNA-binding protein
MAHALKPVLLIGQRGVTPTVTQELAQALDRHELVKIKFIECKVKGDKQRMAEELKDAVSAHLIGMVGHTAIFFRSNPDLEKRKILPPQRPTDHSEQESISA